MLSSYLDGQLFGVQIDAARPAILALHGWGRTNRDFGGVLDDRDGELKGAGSIALDLPGFGASPPPPAAWGAKEYASFLAPILESMDDRIVLVGHSFGGRVAIELAAARPDRIRALVLCGVPVTNDNAGRKGPRFRFRVVRALAKRGVVSEGRLERARERYGSADYRAARGVVRSVLVRVLSENYLPALSSLNVPVELVWGERDTVVPLAVAERALASTRDGRLTVLSGVSHDVPTEAAAALRAIISSHLP